MKMKTSMLKIKKSFKHTVCCGYCDLQNILNKDDAQFYNAGTCGWNCDIYVNYKYNIAISTGYRNMCGPRIPDEIIEKYSKIGSELRRNCWSDENYREKTEENKANFWKAVAEWRGVQA